MKEDLYIARKDIVEEEHIGDNLLVTATESTENHLLKKDLQVPRKTSEGRQKEDDLHITGNNVAEDHRFFDYLHAPEPVVTEILDLEKDVHDLEAEHVPKRIIAEDNILGNELPVSDTQFAKEHRLEDAMHVSGKMIAEKHRFEDAVHEQAKGYTAEHSLTVVVTATETTEKHILADNLHVHKNTFASQERQKEHDLHEGVEEHGTKDADWDRYVKGGETDIRKMINRGLFPPADTLDKLCDCYGRKARIVGDICTLIKDQIKKDIETAFDTKVVDIYPAIKDDAESKIMFVLTLSKPVNVAEIRERVAYVVEIKILNAYNKESTLLAQYLLKKQIFMTKEELQNIQSCQENIEEELFAKHKYLSMITSSPVKSYNYSESDQKLNVERKVCLQLYIHAKGFIPIWEDPFEKKYGDIDTDIIECVFVSYGQTAREPHDYIKMGCRIQRENMSPEHTHLVIKGGTLGGFIEHPELGLCGITCAHAMLQRYEFEKCAENNNKLSLKDWPLNCKQTMAIYQPDKHSSDIGVLSEAYYDAGNSSRPGLDIAVIKIRNRHPVNGMFPVMEQQGIRREVSKVYESGEIVDYTTLATDCNVAVWKFGSTTDSTSAFLLSGTVSAREMPFEDTTTDGYIIKLSKQIKVANTNHVPFAQKGDSGSLVFYEQPNGQLACIGIVEGGCPKDGTLIIVTPIIPVLEQLEVQNIYTFSDTKLYRMEARLEKNFTELIKESHSELKYEIRKSLRHEEEMDVT